MQRFETYLSVCIDRYISQIWAELLKQADISVTIEIHLYFKQATVRWIPSHHMSHGFFYVTTWGNPTFFITPF